MSATSLASPPQPARDLPRRAGHPIFGQLREFRRDRVGLVLEIARSGAEIVEMSMGPGRRVVVISSPALAQEVLVAKSALLTKAPGLSVFLRPVLGSGLLTSERPQHEAQRKLLAPAFAPKRIAAYASTMGERAARFADGLREGESIDLSEALMRLTFQIVGKTLFDAEVEGDASAVGEAITTAMEVSMVQLGALVPLPPWIPSPMNLRYARAVKRLDAVVYRVIRERRAEGGDRGDVLSVLLSTRDENDEGLSDVQIRDEAMTLFSAGHETTANALAWTFDLLARHPDVRARLEEELDALGHDPTFDELKRLPYTLAVFKESMRLMPPVYLLGRRNPETITVGGYVVPKGSILAVNIIGIHRHASLWDSPEEFRPERFLGDAEKRIPRGAYLPFGGGPRVCIGNHFALMEGHVLLANLARRARFDLASTAPTPLEPLITLRPKGGIPVRVRRRRP